jgi:hypothetical protein
VEGLAQAQRVRMAARHVGVVSVSRRARKWRLRLDSAADPPPRLARALTTWSGAQINQAGEITLPITDGADVPDLLRFLVDIKGEGRGVDPSASSLRSHDA